MRTLILLMVLTLSACGGNSTSGTPQTIPASVFKGDASCPGADSKVPQIDRNGTHKLLCTWDHVLFKGKMRRVVVTLYRWPDDDKWQYEKAFYWPNP